MTPKLALVAAFNASTLSYVNYTKVLSSNNILLLYAVANVLF